MGEVLQPEIMNDDYQKEELERCENIIRSGIKNFFEVGYALMRIRELKLYLLSHPTFEAYIEDRWDYSRQYGHRLIAAAETIDNLSPIGRAPENERQVRLLTKLEPEDQRTVWSRVIELSRTETGGRITARLVNKALQEYRAENEAGGNADEAGQAGEQNTEATEEMKALEAYGRIQAAIAKLDAALLFLMNNLGENKGLADIRLNVKNLQIRLADWRNEWFAE